MTNQLTCQIINVQKYMNKLSKDFKPMSHGDRDVNKARVVKAKASKPRPRPRMRK